LLLAGALPDSDVLRRGLSGARSKTGHQQQPEQAPHSGSDLLMRGPFFGLDEIPKDLPWFPFDVWKKKGG